jgi:hypothetical protein
MPENTCEGPCGRVLKGAELEESLCAGCGGIICGDCDNAVGLMGGHDVSDHFAEDEEEVAG